MQQRCDWCKQYVSESKATVVESKGRTLVFCQKADCKGAQASYFKDFIPEREQSDILVVRLARSKRQKLEVEAREQDMTLSAYVRKLISGNTVLC